MDIKRPTRCNRLVSLLQNLLFAQYVSGTIMAIIRSSRVIQMIAAYDTWRFGLQVVGLVWSCGLCVRFAGCFSRNIPAATICIILALLMMGIMVPETCWADKKFCNKETNLLHLVDLLISIYLYMQYNVLRICKLTHRIVPKCTEMCRKWTSRLYSVTEACSVLFCAYILCEGPKRTQALTNNDCSLSRIVNKTGNK